MTIRDAVIGDVPRIVEMGQHFLRASRYADQITENPAQFGKMATTCIESPDGVVLLAEARSGHVVGMLGLLIFAHPLSGQRTAGEICWWVEPSARGTGVQLLKAAEGWATTHGAETLQMVAPTDQVATIYERYGYTLSEVAYVKALTV